MKKYGRFLKKWLLATSDYGDELQEDLNAIVGPDEKFNNAIVRHTLDLKNGGIFQNPNPLNVTFHDIKKCDVVNLILGKLATQVKASKLTGNELTKIILAQDEMAKIENRLEQLKNRKYNGDDDDDEGACGGGGGRGGGNDGTPPRPRPQPRPPTDEADELTRRLNILRGNRPPLPPLRTSPVPVSSQESDNADARDALNNRLNRLRYGSIRQSKDENVLAKRIAQREKEIARIPKGLVKSRKSDAGLFKPILPDTPPPTPNRYDDDYYYYFPIPPGPSDFNFIKPKLPPKSDLDNLPDPTQFLPETNRSTSQTKFR